MHKSGVRAAAERAQEAEVYRTHHAGCYAFNDRRYGHSSSFCLPIFLILAQHIALYIVNNIASNPKKWRRSELR
jgi:D-serine deaminase-like pyridoxal phosphate-dependent protein